MLRFSQSSSSLEVSSPSDSLGVTRSLRRIRLPNPRSILPFNGVRLKQPSLALGSLLHCSSPLNTSHILHSPLGSKHNSSPILSISNLSVTPPPLVTMLLTYNFVLSNSLMRAFEHNLSVVEQVIHQRLITSRPLSSLSVGSSVLLRHCAN